MFKLQKKVLIKILIIVGISVISTLLFSAIKEGKAKNIEVSKAEENEKSYKIEIDNYNISMKFKIFDKYVISEYDIEAKDGSEIKKGDIHVSTSDAANGKEYSVGSTILNYQINGNKAKGIGMYHVFARENKGNLRGLRIKIGIKKENGYEYEEKKFTVPVDKATNDYNNLKKEINSDGIDINFTSIGNFDFGSLLTLYTENLSSKERQKIEENYFIKLKSNNMEEDFSIKPIQQYEEFGIKGISSIGDFNPNSKLTEFFYVSMLYDIKNIDRDNMQVYLVNKQTNEEKLIF